MSDGVDANLAVDIGGEKRFISADYSPFGDPSLLVTQKGRGEFSGNKHRRTTVTNWLGGNQLDGGISFSKYVLTPLTARLQSNSGSTTLNLQWDTTVESYNLSKYTRDPLSTIHGDELFFLGSGDNGVTFGTFQSLGTYKTITESTVDGVRRVQYEMNAGIGGDLLAGEKIYVANFQPGGPYTLSSGGAINTPSSGLRKYSGVSVSGGSGTGGQADITFTSSTGLITEFALHTRFVSPIVGNGYELGDSLTFSITGTTPAYTGGGGRIVSLTSDNLNLTGIAQQLVELVPELNGKGVKAQKGFMLKADHRNTPTIFIGGPTMRNLTGSQINQYPEGIPLGPADSFFIDVTELSQIYVIADANPSGVYSYIYWMDM